MKQLAYWKAQFSLDMNNSNKKRMRIMFISSGMFVLLITTIILLFAFRSGIEFYKSHTQLLGVKDASKRLRDSLKETPRTPTLSCDSIFTGMYRISSFL